MIVPDTFSPFTDSFHDTGNQVHDWVMRRAREHFAVEAGRKADIRDVRAFEAVRTEKRRLFLEAIGGLPDRREPLGVCDRGRLRRDGYLVDKLIYQSLPGVYVCANLYLPEPSGDPAPGVLLVCGHAAEGKAAPKYQRVCIRLVRAGFVVLTVDSPSHGELLQCIEGHTGDPLAGWNTAEHSYLQLAASLTGRNIMRYFIWNAMRALDLLCELPQVDAGRIGVTGNSGGGHLTQALMMTDPRIRAAMPCCSLTTRERYLANGVRAYDGEQNYFGCIPAGLDYDDFLAAFAPRPLRVGAAAHDFFAIEGVHEAFEKARRIYALFDARDKLDLCLATDRAHGYSTPLARGCVDWFARHLLGCEVASPAEDPPVEPTETLRCTKTGHVMTEFDDARSILTLSRRHWQDVRRRAAKAPPPSREDLRQRLALPPAIAPPPHVRRTSRAETPEAVVERLFFFSEPEIVVTAVVYRPHAGPAGATLLLIPEGTEGQAPHTTDIGAWVADGRTVMVFDVRGTGAVRMRRRNNADGLAPRSTEFRVANDHFMLGTSLASRRAFDVLKAVAYLRDRLEPSARADVDLVAEGWPAVYGLLAAAADGHLARCRFAGLPQSWGEAFALEKRDHQRLSESLIAPELQAAYDIADLRRMV